MDRRKGPPRREEDREILEMRERLEKAERKIQAEAERAARMESLIAANTEQLQSHLLSCAASTGRMEMRQESIERDVKEARTGVDKLNNLMLKVLLTVCGGALASLLSLGMSIVQNYIQ